MQFEDIENKDGVRLTWNILPTTPANEEKLAIPIAALYTPTKQLTNCGQVDYKPITCSDAACNSILNPYCTVNYQQKTWNCAICGAKNNFPQQYHGITEMHRPAELLPDYTTLEYILGTPKAQQPVFFYVVDIAVISQELDAVKNSIRQSLSLLPDNALVGFLTYGANIHLYDLGFDYCPKSYTFTGTSPTTVQQLTQRLGLSFGQQSNTAAPNPSGKGPAAGAQTLPGKERFLTPISECEAHLGVILDHLQPDTWVYDSATRPSRCTGLAIALALNLLEFAHHNQNARILALVGGASVTAKPPVASPPSLPPKQATTQAPGKDPKTALANSEKAKKEADKAKADAAAAAAPVVNLGEVATNNFGDPLRSHRDITKNDAPLYQPACDFYSKLALQAVKNRHTVDIFACCLDQVGLSEMYPLVTQTGGELILDDSFTRGVFQGSIKKLLQKEHVYDSNGQDMGPVGNLLMMYSGELRVLTSPHLLVSGGLGHCTNMNQPGQTTNTAAPIGTGKTQSWYLGGLMPDTTFGVYFAINPAKAKKPAPAQPSGQQSYIQFISTFKNAAGCVFIRVTTISRHISDDTNALRQSFDQEAAVVAMTRLALHKLVVDPLQDIRRWLDRQLIRLCVKFAQYTQNEPNSFKLAPDFALYPQQMYYLRRSPLIQIFNSSPDETVFVRTVTLKQDVGNTLTIIQPNLIAYSIASQTPHGEPVLLDSSQLSPQRILLLDTFFHVVVWYGQTIGEWKRKEIWKDQQYAYIGPLIKQPLIEAKQRIESRLPTPRFIECLEGGSQARFMLARLNPSTQATVGTDGEAISFTEDITLNFFSQHLKSLVVANAKEP